eukprot:645827-Amphidinium_carterae.1
MAGMIDKPVQVKLPLPELLAPLRLEHKSPMPAGQKRCTTVSQAPSCLMPVPLPHHNLRSQDRHCTPTCESHLVLKKSAAEADLIPERIGVRVLVLLVLLCHFATGLAAGSPADSASSTPSHLLQETPLPDHNPPVAQGATYHPINV